MKPPICEVCNDRFGAAPDHLITFLSDVATEAFDKRASQPGFVGHRPNTGWFCASHVEAARSLATSMTLSAAIHEIMRIEAGPVDVAPDLENNNLHGGVISTISKEKPAIVWELEPIKNSVALQHFLDLVPVLFDELGLGTPPELECTTRRTWNPMDGARAPDCPYVDLVLHEALRPDGRPAVNVHSDQAHWNDNDISNVASHLFLNVDGGRVSAWASGRGTSDACDSLTLLRPTSKSVVDAIANAFADWIHPSGS